MTPPIWLEGRGRRRHPRTCAAERKKKNCRSRLELAKKARVSQGRLSELEASIEKNPGIDVLKLLARVLRMKMADLLE